MLRAVLDTNLLVSYLLTQGATLSRLIEHWEQEHFVTIISPAMVVELQEVVNRPRLRRQMTADPQILLDVITQDTEQMPGELVVSGVCRDPKDDMLLACAVEGKADYLVTGDQDLLDIGKYQSVQIIRAAHFLEVLNAIQGID